MQNPEMMRQMMDSPMMQSLLNNPDLLRSMLTSNPQMRELMDRNPEVNHILNNPELMRQVLVQCEFHCPSNAWCYFVDAFEYDFVMKTYSLLFSPLVDSEYG